MTEKKVSDRDLLIGHSNGMSRYAIAKKHNITVSAVSYRLRNMGIPSKPFSNKKEWKKLTLSKFKTRHLSINSDLVKKLGFNESEELLYKPTVNEKRILIEVKKP